MSGKNNNRLEKEPDYDIIMNSIKERSKGTWINSYDNLKKLWKDGLIGKNEFEDHLGELGLPERGTLGLLKGFSRSYACSNSNKKKSEKTIIKIYPKNKN